MLGLLQSIRNEFENMGLAVEGVFVNAKCAASNLAADVKIARAQRSSGGVYDDEDIDNTEEPGIEETLSVEKTHFYEELFEKLVKHEDFCVRNLVDTATELGYSEDDVKEAFVYLQQKLEKDQKECVPYGNGGLGRGLNELMEQKGLIRMRARNHHPRRDMFINSSCDEEKE